MQDDLKLEWLRAYCAKAGRGKPYAPNVRNALLEMLDSGMSPAEVQRLTGCLAQTLYRFMDIRRRASADLRRAERGKSEDKAIRVQVLADRDARLKAMPVSSIEIDLLGSPPPGRSALDMRKRMESGE